MNGRQIQLEISKLRDKYDTLFSDNNISITDLINKHIPLFKTSGLDYHILDNRDAELNELKKKVEELAEELYKYGVSDKTRLLYQFFTSEFRPEVKLVLDNPSTESLYTRLNSIYGKNVIYVADMGIEIEESEFYTDDISDEDIIELFGKEYTLPFVELIGACIAIDMRIMLTKIGLIMLVKRAEREFNIKLKINSIEELIATIGRRTFFVHLFKNMSDIDIWLEQNNTLEFLKIKLKGINVNKTQFAKMQMIGTDKYKGMSKRSAIAMQILKDLVSMQIQFNKDNPWVLREHNKETIKVSNRNIQRELSQIYPRYFDLLSDKIIIRYAIMHIGMAGVCYQEELEELVSKGKQVKDYYTIQYFNASDRDNIEKDELIQAKVFMDE